MVTSDGGLFCPWEWSVCCCVYMVGPGFDSTSPAFVRSKASHVAGTDSQFDPPPRKTESLGAGSF